METGSGDGHTGPVDLVMTPLEAAVAHAWEVLASDRLPDLAARWLADGADGESLAELAGAPSLDVWVVEELWERAREELGVVVQGDTEKQVGVLVRFELARWRAGEQSSNDTVAAVQVIAVRSDLPSGSRLRLDLVYLDEANAGDDEHGPQESERDDVRALADLEDRLGPRGS